MSDITTRAAKIAREAATKIAAKAKNYITFRIKPHDWPGLSAHLGIDIPSTFTEQPFTWQSVNGFSQYWINTWESRLNDSIKDSGLYTPKLKVAQTVSTFGTATLLPEQQSVVDKIWDDLIISNKHQLKYQDGETGSGKTFVAAALLAKCIELGIHKIPGMPMDLPYRYWVVTRKAVIEQFKRVLEDFGLGKHIGGLIYVTSYSSLTSSTGERLFYQEVYDAYADDVIIKINEVFKPCLMVLDEAHALNQPKTAQTKVILAYTRSKNPPKQLWMSATPWVTVNNSRSFVLSANTILLGMRIDEQTWPAFAGSIAKEPHKPNQAAAKRLREVLNDYIVSFPYVKWPHKAINQVLIIDFERAEHRELYQNSYDIYQERKRKAGKNTSYGAFDAFVALNVFRHAVEPFHVPAMIERSLDELSKGNAVLIGAAYRETIAQAAFRLVRAGIPREKITIVWGGKRAWKKDLILSEEELNDLLERGSKGESLDPYEVRSLQETILYNTERIMAGETEDTHGARVQEMIDLGLMSMQSQAARQYEIDKFQSGQAEICLFTLAAGGVGLSLDHCRQGLRPRVGYFTPTFNGPEFKQALGRAVRRTTLSDTYQYMCYMKDTVEEYHVAPLIDRKLKCIGEITKSSFNIIDIDTCTKIEHKYRTKEQAVQEADSDESQFKAGDSDQEEDNED